MSDVLDVAVIGPGTVGLYLAAALADGPRVALIGGPRGADDVLGGRPETSGHHGVRSGWRGGYGGTSTIWGGQLWPWQPWEIVGGPSRSPWPLDHARDLAPHYRRVLPRLGLDAATRAAIHDRAGFERWPELRTAETEVRYSTWMDRRHRDFRLNPAIRGPAHRALRIRTDVARIEPRRHGLSALLDAEGVEVAVARKVVLAAGTLGNIRLLQIHDALTGSVRPTGRFFGDHLSARAARVRVVDRRRFEAFAAHRFIRDGRMTTRLATTAAHSAASGALPAYAHFEVASPSVSAARSLARARGADLVPAAHELLGQAPRLPRLAVATAQALSDGRRPIDPTGEVFVRIDVEQPLRERAAVRWNGAGDLRLDWSIGDAERDAVTAALLRFAPLMEQHLGVTVEPLPEFELQDIYHLMGGTRMGRRDDPTAIVDQDQRVIDAENLWVAGASTYPSGGMANPTFTALALADRMTGRLR